MLCCTRKWWRYETRYAFKVTVVQIWIVYEPRNILVALILENCTQRLNRREYCGSIFQLWVHCPVDHETFCLEELAMSLVLTTFRFLHDRNCPGSRRDGSQTSNQGLVVVNEFSPRVGCSSKKSWMDHAYNKCDRNCSKHPRFVTFKHVIFIAPGLSSLRHM